MKHLAIFLFGIIFCNGLYAQTEIADKDILVKLGCYSYQNRTPEPLFILDNKRISQRRLKNKWERIHNDSISKIYELEIIKGDSAIVMYGKKAINGVVVITTKKKKAKN